jgi:hypothetical protein
VAALYLAHVGDVRRRRRRRRSGGDVRGELLVRYGTVQAPAVLREMGFGMG